MAGRYGNFQNPFYVEPGGNLNIGITGLHRGMQNYKIRKDAEDAKAEKEERAAKAAEAGLAAYKSGDLTEMAKVILEFPESAHVIGQLHEMRKDYNKEEHIKALEETLTEIETTGTLAPETSEPPLYDPRGGLSGGIGGEYPGEYGSAATIATKETNPSEFGLPGKPGSKLSKKIDVLRSIYDQNPEAGKRAIEYDFAKRAPKEYEAWKDIYRPGEKEATPTDLKKKIDERQALLDEGVAKDDPRIKAYDDDIWPKDDDGDVAPSNVMKMYAEREKLLAEGKDPKSDIIRGLNTRILGEAAGKVFSPSGLMKLITESEELKEKLAIEGLSETEIEEHPYVQAYENRIAGMDINVKDLTPEEYEFLGIYAYVTGKMPSVGRGKMATKVRMGILKAKANYGMKVAREELAAVGIEIPEGELPAVAAFNAVTTSRETKAIGGAWNWLEKQEASMGSYVDNIGKQLNELKNLSKDLYSFDARILNVPLRFIRGRIMGSPLQNKYDLFLKEISRETTKLALGATQSIAPPSVEEIKTWDRIHDPALSVPDAIEVLEMSYHAANLRYKSVTDQLGRIRERMKTRDYSKTLFNKDEAEAEAEMPKVTTAEDYKKIESGEIYFDTEIGKPVRKK
jgi:hypothetical protein